MTTNRYELVSTENPEDAPEEIALVRAPFPELEEALRDANTKLKEAGSGWRLELESDGTHGLVLPIKVTYDDAFRSTRHVRDLAGFLAHLRRPIPVLFDRILIPSPGHRPNNQGGASYQLGAGARGDFGRVPVAVVANEPPPRTAVSGRRPVVALLDTAIEPHDWLGEADGHLGGDGFWVDARSKGWDPGPRLRLPESSERSELGETEGHGTFSAGLVRQVAPDVQVLGVRVIRDDGRVDGDHVLNALDWLAHEDTDLVAGDVVCVPAGFRPVFPYDRAFLELLADVLARLADREIRVVAAAGNDASSDPVYPAAFAASTGVPEHVRVVSVGATNTDGMTPAYFSNYGDWVTRWEIGTSVLSTFPMVNRLAAPEFVAKPQPKDPSHFPVRESADPDDFVRRTPTSSSTPPVWEMGEGEVRLTGGFARWSGTSFAAAIHAGKLAQEQIGPLDDSGAARSDRP